MEKQTQKKNQFMISNERILKPWFTTDPNLIRFNFSTLLEAKISCQNYVQKYYIDSPLSCRLCHNIIQKFYSESNLVLHIFIYPMGDIFRQYA